MLPNQAQRLILLEHVGASAIAVVGIVFLPGVDGILGICIGALCWFGSTRYERAKTPKIPGPPISETAAPFTLKK